VGVPHLLPRLVCPCISTHHLVFSGTAHSPADVLTANTSAIEQPNKIEHASTIEKSIPNVEARVPVEWVTERPATNSGSPSDEMGQYVVSVKGRSLALFQRRGRAKS